MYWSASLRTALSFNLLAAAAVLLLPGDSFAAEQPTTSGWQAGTARAVITPQTSMWMAGYASRTKPSEGQVQDLFAKAVALQDPDGQRLVIVTTDLIGIPLALRERLQQAVAQQFQLPAAGLLLNASHTHCGPEFRTSKTALAGLDAARVEQGHQYFLFLQETLLRLIGESLQQLQPAQLSYTHGRAGFSMNRRLPTETEPRNAPYPDGPVDQDVPVLKVTTAGGDLLALLFGYACHNTTLSFYQFCGDYAGYAQQDLEAAFPGCTALFLTGCGGDQNPQPRGTLELAEHHGSALAVAVQAALLGPLRPIDGGLRTALDSVPLEFAEPPTRSELETLATSSNGSFQRRAQALLQELDDHGALRRTYPYLVQTVRLGDDLLLVALAGEVVVDYSLRLKRELQGRAGAVWIAGYSNDVFGYVPSERVLQEGGYEGGGAMNYSTLPGPFAPGVETRIVDKVHALVNQVSQ